MVFGILFRMMFRLFLPVPPRSGAGGGLDKFVAHTGEQERLAFVPIFRFPVDTFSPYPLAAGMAMAFVDDVFLSLTAIGLPFFFLFRRTLPAS